MMKLPRLQSAVPGILGGLGPLAHLEFERKLLNASTQRGAQSDQDHPVWFLVNGTSIPDRTQSLMDQTNRCVPSLVKYAKLLETMGSDFLIVTCNTAHAFYDLVQEQLQIPWIHLMEHTAAYIIKNHPDVQNVGVLATNGTLHSGLYEDHLTPVGLNPISPQIQSELQTRIMETIYHPEWGIKATGATVSNQAMEVLMAIAYQFKDLGAELIIAGCTELSVAFAKMQHLPIAWVDPLDIMAQVVLDLAYDHQQSPQLHSPVPQKKLVCCCS